LIIVDNKSKDKTVAYIESLEDDRITLIKNDKNVGCIRARNQGIAVSKTSYTMVIDDDQIPNNDTFVRYLDTLKHFDVVGCELQIMNFKTGLTTLGTQSNFTYVGAGGMCMRTCNWIELGLFDEIFSPAYFEDPDIVEKARDCGLTIGYVKNHGIRHLEHRTLSSNNLNYDPAAIMLRNRKIFKSRYKDSVNWNGSRGCSTKVNKIKILYVVPNSSVVEMLNNKRLVDSWNNNLNLDVGIFAQVDLSKERNYRPRKNPPGITMYSNVGYKDEFVENSDHRIYINTSHKLQYVYLNNGEGRSIKPGGEISDYLCSALKGMNAFRFSRWDKKVLKSHAYDAISPIDFIKKFEPRVIYYLNSINLDSIVGVENSQAFKRLESISMLIDNTWIEGCNIIVSMED